MRATLREHRAFLAIAIAIVAVRLAFAFAFPIAQISDYQSYFDSAQRVAGLKEGRLDSWNPIGPKLVYAVPLRLFGADVRVIGVSNAILFLLGVGCLYAGAIRTFDRPTAVLTSLLSLLSLSDLYFNNLACTEVLAGLSLNALFLGLTKGVRVRELVVLGLVLGLGTYNRSNMLAMGGVVLLLDWVRTRSVGTTLRRFGIVQVSAFVVLLPLCFFDLSRFGRFTPVTSNSGMQIWYGNNPNAGLGSHFYARLPEEFAVGNRERKELANAYRSFFPAAGRGSTLGPNDPYALPELGIRYAFAWIRANPGKYAHFSLWRIRQLYEQCTFGVAPYLFYDPEQPGQPEWQPGLRAILLGKGAPIRKFDGPPNPRTALSRFVMREYQVLAVGAALGLVVTILHVLVSRAQPMRLMAALILVVYTAPFALTIALNRYHVPVLGLMWLYLAHALVLCGRWLRTSWRGPASEPRG